MYSIWSIDKISKSMFAVLIVLIAGLFLPFSTPLALGEGIEIPGESSGGNIVSDVRNKKTRNQEDLNKLILKYGLVHNRSVNASLKDISLRLGPYFDHPEFRLKIVILDREKIMAYLLNGQTLVLTRGMVYSGLLESTDQIAGVLSFLLAEQEFTHLEMEEKKITTHTGEVLSDQFGIKPTLRPVLYAALAMVLAGYHYQGIIDAVHLLGKSRKDTTLFTTGKFLLDRKTRVLKAAGFFFEGQTAVLVHHNMTAIYDLSRFLSLFPLSVGGHFLLGLAYYQSFSETRPYSLHRFLFLADPVPILRTQETPLDIGALDAAESEWDLALKLNPAYSPSLNGKGRILLLKGHKKEARTFFRRAFNLIDNSPWYQADYAFSLLMHQHSIKGMRLFNEALHKATYDPKLMYDLAVWNTMNNHSRQSAVIFQKLSALPGWRYLIRGTHPHLSFPQPPPDEKVEKDSFFLNPGETMVAVQKKIGLPKTPPIELYGRTIWYYSGRGIRLIFHGQNLYYAIFEKKWGSQELGGFYVGEKYSPTDPGALRPSWVVPYGRDPYLIFKKQFGYVAVSEKNGYITQISVSIVPPNSTVNKDLLESGPPGH